MGGGVVLNLSDLAPEKVRSVSMVSAIGVQEYELLGQYHLNHALHGIQLGFFWFLKELTPNFGIFDRMVIPYSRNFYDSDQRPLRVDLQKIEAPFLIIHGTQDPLVPVEAAREHARLVPQSEYHELTEENHFMIFMHPEKVFPLVENFLSEVVPRLCFGVQSLNVHRGGSLVQDIPSMVEGPLTHDEDDGKPPARHMVRVAEDSLIARLAARSEFEVNSYHHQAVQSPGRNLRAVAFAPDGVIEAVEDTTGRFIVGVQWHPERGWKDDPFSKALFSSFIEHARVSL